jgi:hypothetical protein
MATGLQRHAMQQQHRQQQHQHSGLSSVPRMHSPWRRGSQQEEVAGSGWPS